MIFSQSPPTFDPLHTELSGTLLIEASAGTGKTHTIASLVLRLVAEKGIPIEKILVVTFTEAAAAELKERIYARLSDMLMALEGQASTAFAMEMAEFLFKKNIARTLAKSRVLASLRNFDRSLIGTIHAFCSRMLKENRFESGMRLDAELFKDAPFLLEEAARDVWRMEVVPLKGEEARFLLKEGFTPERLAKLTGICGKPDQKILPEENEIPDFRKLGANVEKAAEDVRQYWRKNREALTSLLLHSPDLSRGILRAATLEKGFPLIDQWGSGEKYPEILKKFTPSEITRATKTGKTTPSDPFFDLCALCVEAAEALDTAQKLSEAVFLKDLIQKTRERAEFLKEKKGVFTYDDLLYATREAVLAGENSAMLESIRSRFSAALIDEFQDTDMVQYAIFDRVFAKAGLPLFLIGDPKQAIYSFRGADVFAYLSAVEKSERRYTLASNWRSDPALIRAVTRIFSKNKRAFILEGLDFYPVSAADRQREIFYDPGDPFPLRIWKVGGEFEEKSANLKDMRPAVIAAMAEEIVRLVEGGCTGRVKIGERGVGPGDIAVLVRSNKEASWVREAFSERGIPAVIQAEGNVLDSSEAEDLEILLHAILNPSDAFAIRRVLVTESMGFSLSRILSLNEDERAFSGILTAFSSAKNLWREKGIFPMLMDFYEKFEILSRAAAYAMGERRVTNLLHLAEILHQAERSENLDPGLLFSWFSRQRLEDIPGRVEAPLRLESDEKRVRIVTIHKAKGLEYAIVFCPFIAEAINPLDSSKNPEKVLFFHDGPEKEALVFLDDGSERTREIALYERELQAEGVRLLYVAMTRASHKLYLAWGNIKNWQKSAAAWLFHGVSEKDSLNSQREDLHFLEEEGDIAVSPLPEEKGVHLETKGDFAEELVRCQHAPLPPDFFRVTSFSSMAAGSALEETRDMDGLAGSGKKRETRPDGGIFAFPAGSRPGTFMHAVFEQIDFTLDAGHFLEKSEKLLFAHGYDTAWAPVISGMVEKVLSLPIGPVKLHLKDIPLTDQLRELDFYLPLKSFDPMLFADAVRRLTGEACGDIPSRLGKIRFSRTEGYLRGIMDLVFRHQGKYYLVDWKSNHLGDTHQDYSPEKLAEEMGRHLYTLQYHLYILALDRHLSLHLEDYDYERDFGGMAYIFLRGVDPALSPEYGLFEHKPSMETIRALADLLLEEPGKGLAPTGI